MNWKIDYDAILAEGADHTLAERIGFVEAELPYIWAHVYREASDRPTDICVIPINTFTYLFDYYESYANSHHPDYDEKQDSRLVVAYGISAPKITKRDDGRLKGWVGATETYLGKEWDKGHFIAHSIGGAVYQSELNVFPQLKGAKSGSFR